MRTPRVSEDFVPISELKAQAAEFKSLAEKVTKGHQSMQADFQAREDRRAQLSEAVVADLRTTLGVVTAKHEAEVTALREALARLEGRVTKKPSEASVPYGSAVSSEAESAETSS